jgi:hypothetical protein
MEVERCPNCGESKTLPASLFAGVDRPAVSMYPAGMIVPLSATTLGVPIPHGFHCCLCCGHVWSRLSTDALEALLGGRATKLGRQYLQIVRKGPYHDVPDDSAAHEAADATAEIDQLLVLGKDAAATRRYRDRSGRTWDEAIEAVRRWRSLGRPEKLKLFGWPPEEKQPVKDPGVRTHPMSDPWLDG